MINYLEYVFIFLLFFVFFSCASALDFSGCQEKTFVVTAYYSPLSGQAFYYKSSYKDEKILNGEGYCGAGGKKVFNGMLAGPVSYAFGTIIYFPGWGIGEIADRGGAIVEAGEKGQNYDRIDIWMGKGEEGLIRALTFGKKTLTGYLCDKSLYNKKIKFGLDWGNVPVLKNFFDVAIWIQQLEFGRQDIRVWTLQKYLINLGHLDKSRHTGIYDLRTQKAVCNYQVKRGIVSRKSKDCGKFGSMTRYKMKLEVTEKNLLPKDLFATTSVDDVINQARKHNSTNSEQLKTNSSNVVAKNKNIFQFYRAYKKNQNSSEIKILQSFLSGEKLYSGKIDGIYSQKVMDSVYEFQKKYGILIYKSDIRLRGYLGPSTRKKINILRK